MSFAAVMFAVMLGATQPARAGMTTADFLKWERKAQDSYIQIGISMAGVISAQFRPEVARCIDNWYFRDNAVQTARNNEMLRKMPQFAKFHPTAVILGFVQQACGDIKP